jgi:hypothetical protein
VIYIDNNVCDKVSRRYCSVVGLRVNSPSISQSMMIFTGPMRYSCVCMCNAGDWRLVLVARVTVLTVLFLLDLYRPYMGIWYNGKSSLLSSMFAVWVSNCNISQLSFIYSAC